MSIYGSWLNALESDRLADIQKLFHCFDHKQQHKSLTMLVSKNHLKSARFLLNQMKKPNDDELDTLFYISIMEAKSLEMLKLILEFNEKRKFNFDFLTMATVLKNIEIVKHLVEFYDRQGWFNSWKITMLLSKVASEGNLNLYKYLRSKFQSEKNTFKGSFRAAIEGNSIELVKHIYESEIGIENARAFGKQLDSSFAYIPCRTGNLEILKYLVEVCCISIDHDRESDYGQSETCLSVAISIGNLDVVKYLVEKGIDFNKRDKFNRTQIWYCAYLGRYEILKFLVEKGGEWEQLDYGEENALHIASKRGYIDITTFLLFSQNVKK